MPPWHLDPTIGIQEYKNDFSLSDEQIEILVAWVDNGAPEGDSSIYPTSRLAKLARMGARADLGADMVFESGPISVRAEGGDFAINRR